MEKVIELRIDEIDRFHIKESLQEFFVELNWQLYAKFRKTISEEFGLSLLLVVFYENEAFIVQFGRILCGLLFGGKLTHIGRDWQNFAIKTKEELFLLGSRDENISVEVYKVRLENGSVLFALPSVKIAALKKLGINALSLKEHISVLYEKEIFPYFIVKVGKTVLKKRKNIFRLHRHRFLALLLGFLVVLSAVYVFFGKNWLAEKQHILKEKNRQFQNNEVLEKLVQTQNQLQETINEIFKQNKSLEIFPNQKIEIKEVWSKEIPINVTFCPLFDYKRIYLIDKREILTIKKNSQKTNWGKNFSSEIINVNLLDANRLLVVLKNSELFCLNRDSGKIIWRRNGDVNAISDSGISPSYQISIDNYKNLDTSVVLLHNSNSITLLNNINGRTMAEFHTGKTIKFVSKFDQLEKCVYVIENDNEIKKIVFKVLS